MFGKRRITTPRRGAPLPLEPGVSAIIAVAGHPNCGKTTLFNRLTRLEERVGNWPGVTVEVAKGKYFLAEISTTLMDLPGCYSLASSPNETPLDEKAASDFILSQKVDLVLNVIDITQLSRQLYFTLQLVEQRQPYILVVNTMGRELTKAQRILFAVLARRLGGPVIPLDVEKEENLQLLHHTIETVLQAPKDMIPVLPYWDILESYLVPWVKQGYSEASLLRALESNINGETDSFFKFSVHKLYDKLKSVLNEEPDIWLAKARHGYIESLLRREEDKNNPSLEDELPPHIEGHQASLDKWLLHRWWGLPAFACIMYLLFFIGVQGGAIFQDFFEITADTFLVQGLGDILKNWGVPLLTIKAFQGVGLGICTTLTFVPVIAGMFCSLTFLENSGYMARAAFIMDKAMRFFRLPAKSFVPLLLGFGCNVPAIMSARTLENPNERLVTILMTPFMSCGARLVIYAVFASVFFPGESGKVILGLYVIGMLAAILTGCLLQSLMPMKASPLLVQLPSYRWPIWSRLLRIVGNRVYQFVYKAGLVIVPCCLLISLLLGVGDPRQSVLARIGESLTPIFEPMGLTQDNWPATVGLLTGVVAKEVVVGTLSTLYQGETTALTTAAPNFRQQMKLAIATIPMNFKNTFKGFGSPLSLSFEENPPAPVLKGLQNAFKDPLAAFAYLIFILLYFPCISVVAVVAKELNMAWAAFTVVWSTGLAYSAAVLFYQSAHFATHPTATLQWWCGIILFWSFTWAVAKLLFKTQRKSRSGRSLPTPIKLV